MPSRSFSPLIGALRQLPNDAKLLAADLDCDGLREILLLGGDSETTLSHVTSNGELEPLSGELAIGAPELLSLESGSFESFITLPRELTATGRFTYAGQPCEMLALPAPKGAPAVDVYASRNGGLSIQNVARVQYPADADLPSRWFFIDVDGDGSQDLFLTTRAGEQWVSYGSGDGTFTPTVTVLDTFEEILTAGELDNFDGTDYFRASTSTGLYYQARALDLTGDFRTDVAAVGAQRRIDLYRGHQTGLSSKLSLPLRGVPHIEDVGDFDGDGVSDLLVSEADAEDKPAKTASILFAPVHSGTAGAVELASFERIEQMVAGYVEREFEFPDASTDIGVLFRQKGETEQDEGPLQLGFMEGGADRLLRSRLPTAKGSYFYGGSPVIGHFHSDDQLELALFRDSTTYREDGSTDEVSTQVDLLTVGADGIAYVRRITFPNLDFSLPYSPANDGVVTLDLDLDGLDEIYVSTASAVVRLVGKGKGFDATSVWQTDGLIDGFAAQDADGDGKLDLTVLVESGLRVLRAGAAGDDVIDLSELDCEILTYEYAFVQADADPELELVTNCYDNYDDAYPEGPEGIQIQPDLVIYDVSLAEGRLSRLKTGPGLVTRTFVTGDFNGDGVQDLVGGYEELVVMLGKPR
jgi:hypothetical protein